MWKEKMEQPCHWCGEPAIQGSYCPGCLRLETRIWRSRFLLCCHQMLHFGSIRPIDVNLLLRRLNFMLSALLRGPVLVIGCFLAAWHTADPQELLAKAGLAPLSASLAPPPGEPVAESHSGDA